MSSTGWNSKLFSSACYFRHFSSEKIAKWQNVPPEKHRLLELSALQNNIEGLEVKRCIEKVCLTMHPAGKSGELLAWKETAGANKWYELQHLPVFDIFPSQRPK